MSAGAITVLGMVRIIAWRVPPYDNDCYVIVDDAEEAIVIDPSMGERQVIDAVREQGLRLVEILNTHGHADHIFGNAAVKEATRARLAIHRLRRVPARTEASTHGARCAAVRRRRPLR